MLGLIGASSKIPVVHIECQDHFVKDMIVNKGYYYIGSATLTDVVRNCISLALFLACHLTVWVGIK